MVTYLALGDFGWSVSMAISTAILWTDRTLYTETNCIVFRVLFQVFAGSSVFWTTCIAYYLWKALSAKQIDARRRTVFLSGAFSQHPSTSSSLDSTLMWTVFYLTSWLMPMVLALIPVLVPGWMTTDQFGICFPIPMIHFLFWFGPVAFAFFTTLVIYIANVIKSRLQQIKKTSRYNDTR